MRDPNDNNPLLEQFERGGLIDLDQLRMRSRLLHRIFGDPELGPRVGPHVVLRKLERASVPTFLSHDTRRGVRGVLQVLPALPEAAMEQLWTDIAAFSRISDPHVPALLDHGVFEDRIWIVTAFHQTVSMRDWLCSQPRGWAEVIEQMIGLGHGLARLHEQGLVHGEVGPDAFVVCPNDRALLLDTLPAIARRLVEHQEPASFNLPKASKPTLADDQADLGVAIHGALLALESQHDVELPSWLVPILHRTMSTRPDHRWSSVQALVDHLEHRLRMRPRLMVISGGAAA